MTLRRLTPVLLVALVVAALVVPFALAQPENRTARREVRARTRPDTPRPSLRNRRPFGRERAERMGCDLGLIVKMKRVCSDPTVAGIVAVGGLKDDVKRKDEEIIADFESQLAKTKSLPLRNAIRLTLKDLYKKTSQDKKLLEHLRAMIAENDAAILKSGGEAATPKSDE